MKSLLFVIAVFFGCSLAGAQSIASCNGQQTSSSASSLACSSSLSLQANDVVTGTFYASSVGAGYAITLCGLPVTYVWNNDTSVAGWVFISLTTQTCTPTVTYNGSISGNNALLNAAVWRGFAPYPIATALIGWESTTTPQSQTGLTVPNYDSSDTILSLMTYQGNTNSCTTQTATFAVDSSTAGFVPAGSNCIFSQIMYRNGSTSAGNPYTNTIGTTNVNQMWSYSLVLRSTMPTIGAIQVQGCTTRVASTSTPVSSLPCPLPQPSQTGDILLGELGDGFNISSITGPAGVTCYGAGVLQNDNQFQRKFWCSLPNPAPSSPVTITVTPPSGTADYDLIIKEVAGIAGLNLLAASSDNALHRGTTSTTQAAGPLYVYENGPYYFDGFMDGDNSNLEQVSVLPNSGFSREFLFHWANFILADYDAAFTASGSFLSQSFSATTVASLSPSSYLFAWAASPYSHPTAIQGRSGFNGGSITIGVDDPENDAGVYVCAQGSGPWTVTPSWTSSLSTIDGCGSGDQKCVKYAPTIPAGAESVTVVNAASQAFATVQKVRALGALDSHAVASASGGTVGPVNATSSGANEFTELCGMNQGSSTGTYTVPTYTSGTNGALTVPNFSDQQANTVAEAFLPTAGTYGATWNTASGFTDPASVIADAAIFFYNDQPAHSLSWCRARRERRHWWK